MKLALVVSGGVARDGEYNVIPVLVSLIERLSYAHEVHVFTLLQEPVPACWKLAGATIHNIGPGRTIPRSIVAIRAEHRRARFDLLHAIFSGPCGLIAVAAAKLLRLPSMVHYTGGELVAMSDIGYGGQLNWKGRLSERITLRGADLVTATSAPILDELQAFGVQGRRVPLGVDLRKWPPRTPRRRNGGPARLIHVASLNRVKDQPTLLHALARLVETGMDFEMDIVGVDTLQGEMQELLRQLDLDGRVRFVGFRTQRELRPLVESADLLVLSSRHEAGPVVLLEAAVVGVPTVGTAVGHVAEWAPSAALAVPAGNPERLADAIHTLLGDEDLRLRVARAAQCRALSQDADYTARAFEALYLRLTATR